VALSTLVAVMTTAAEVFGMIVSQAIGAVLCYELLFSVAVPLAQSSLRAEYPYCQSSQHKYR